MSAAYSSYASRMGDISLPPLETDYASEIENYPTWVAELDGEIVAGLIMAFDKDAASISNVAVHPNAQGQGLGRILLDFAEQQARIKGYSQLALATHVLLTENISLYEHLGWKISGRDQTRVYFEKSI